MERDLNNIIYSRFDYNKKQIDSKEDKIKKEYLKKLNHNMIKKSQERFENIVGHHKKIAKQSFCKDVNAINNFHKLIFD
jgi:hypothetical protein